MTDFNKSQGAMWTKKDKNGNIFYSGQIEINKVKHGFIAFSNRKEKSIQPDFRIYLNAVESQKETVEDDVPF